jgi:hypothetical protein
LSWQQLALLVTAFKAASSSSQILVSEAAELMLKAGTTSQDACFPWQVSSQSAHAAAAHLACIEPALFEQLLSSLTFNAAQHVSADHVMPCAL